MVGQCLDAPFRVDCYTDVGKFKSAFVAWGIANCNGFRGINVQSFKYFLCLKKFEIRTRVVFLEGIKG